MFDSPDPLWDRFEQTGSIEAYMAWRSSLSGTIDTLGYEPQEGNTHEGEQGQRADHQRSPYGGQGQATGYADTGEGQDIRDR